jgi:hypothetical protein
MLSVCDIQYALLNFSHVLIFAAIRMEDLLQNIIKDAAGKQNQNLKQAAQIAYGKNFSRKN